MLACICQTTPKLIQSKGTCTIICVEPVTLQCVPIQSSSISVRFSDSDDPSQLDLATEHSVQCEWINYRSCLLLQVINNLVRSVIFHMILQ